MELVISLAIIAGGISAVLVVFQSSLKGLNQSDAKLQEAGILNEIHLTLNNKEVCDRNFLSKVLDTNGALNLTAIQDSLGNRIADVATNTPGAALKVSGLQIVTDPTVWAAYQAAKASLPAEGYLLSTNLRVTIQRLRQSSEGDMRETTLNMAMPLFIDTNGAVKGCLTPASALEEAALATSCSQVGGVIDPVTKTCRFNLGCGATAEDGKPFDSNCMNEEITELKKTIADLESQVKARKNPKDLKDLMARMKECMSSAATRTDSRFDGTQVRCDGGDGSASYFTVTRDTVIAFGYTIKDPKIAAQLYDEISKYYVDYYLKDIMVDMP